MKITEVNTNTLKDYLRIAKLQTDEDKLLEMIIASAKACVLSFTGLKEEEADKYQDLTIAFLLLCQDMYDNRSFYVDKNNINKVAETILFMHAGNLL